MGVVKLLLDRGANVNSADKYGKTPLFLASANGYSDIVNNLKLKGAK